MKAVGASLPPDVVAYKRTPEFSAETVPAGLLKDHATKDGVWGVIHVVEGQLRYIVPDAQVDAVLDRHTQGIVTPQQRHRVETMGDVRFFVEFLNRR